VTDFAADAPISSGVTVTERSGATLGTDTVPAGCTLLLRNTGAGTHVVTLQVNTTFDGLTITNRTHSLTTLTNKLVRVPANYGDANGRVGIGVDGTAAELKYTVIGA
jgi:hypothetical protein